MRIATALVIGIALATAVAGAAQAQNVGVGLSPAPPPPGGVMPAAFAEPALGPALSPSGAVPPPPEPTPFTPGMSVQTGVTTQPMVPLGAPMAVESSTSWGSWIPAVQNGEDRNLVLFTDADSWHGIADRGSGVNRTSNNDGGSFGFNYATRLGRVSDLTGIGLQVGGSYGVYDWNGRPFNFGTLNTVAAQQQTFFTVGFFKRADGISRVSYGFVHDWMINQAWGAYAVNPTFGQWRGQVSVAISDRNELGTWFTFYDKGSTNLDFFGGSVVSRSIDQSNFFWHHKWDLGADSWFWIGVPQSTRLNPFAGGSLGDLLIGGSIIAPMNDYVSLYANAQYMHPSAAPSPIAAGEESWYVAFGLQFTIGGRGRSDSVIGNRWMPLMPVANNGNFLVDSVHFF